MMKIRKMLTDEDYQSFHKEMTEGETPVKGIISPPVAYPAIIAYILIPQRNLGAMWEDVIHYGYVYPQDFEQPGLSPNVCDTERCEI